MTDVVEQAKKRFLTGFDGLAPDAQLALAETLEALADAKDAELAVLRKERDEARAQNREARRLISATHKHCVTHTNCRELRCPICEGGLFVCADCGAAEIEAEERICTGPVQACDAELARWKSDYYGDTKRLERERDLWKHTAKAERQKVEARDKLSAETLAHLRGLLETIGCVSNNCIKSDGQKTVSELVTVAQHYLNKISHTPRPSPPIPSNVSPKPSTPLEKLLADAVVRFNALSPEEQDAHLKAQRESWVRGQIGMGD